MPTSLPGLRSPDRHYPVVHCLAEHCRLAGRLQPSKAVSRCSGCQPPLRKAGQRQAVQRTDITPAVACTDTIAGVSTATSSSPGIVTAGASSTTSGSVRGEPPFSTTPPYPRTPPCYGRRRHGGGSTASRMRAVCGRPVGNVSKAAYAPPLSQAAQPRRRRAR